VAALPSPAGRTSSGGRSRQTAAARRLTEEEPGSPRGFSAPALASPARAIHRMCGVTGPPRGPPPLGAADVVLCAALSWRRRRRRGGRGGGRAEEVAAEREAGGIGWVGWRRCVVVRWREWETLEAAKE
jgi:hypothetical protein